MDTVELMRAIDSEYRAHTGLSDARLCKIFYSRIDPAPLLILGANPVGDPDQPESLKSASASFFKNYEHDSVDCSYTIQRMMLPFLQHVLRSGSEQIRRIPKTNLAFRRSARESDFKEIHGMSLLTGMKESKPWLGQIIEHVSPRMILLETMKPEIFASLHGYTTWSEGIPIADEVRAEHRGTMVRAFPARELRIKSLSTAVPVVAIGHPSVGSFSRPNVWGAITKAVDDVCQRYRIACMWRVVA